MDCHCCVRLVQILLEKAGVMVRDILPGEADIAFDEAVIGIEEIQNLLSSEGFELIFDREQHLAQKIKRAVIDLVHHTTYNSMVRNSDYLVGRFNLSYSHLSSVFSRSEHITLEKFIIRQRIARAMELIQTEELTLSEIAFMMGYSSVQYLSTQFREVAGVSVSDFRKDPARYRALFFEKQSGDKTQIASDQ